MHQLSHFDPSPRKDFIKKGCKCDEAGRVSKKLIHDVLNKFHVQRQQKEDKLQDVT